MLKYRWGYFAFFLVTLLALIMEENLFFAILLIVEILFPVLLIILLKYEAQRISLKIHVLGNRTRMNDLNLQVKVTERSRMWVSGVIELSLSIHNVFCDQTRKERFLIPVSRKDQEYVATKKITTCGRKNLVFEKAVLHDIFGLCSVELEIPKNQDVVVYPRELHVHLEQNDRYHGYSVGGHQTQNHRGKDPSEIFELKEYQPGDDVRSIHWKISSKMEHLVVKEASDTIYLDTMVMCDAGIAGKDGRWPDHVLGGAVEMAASLSAELIRLGMEHCMGIVTEQDSVLVPVTTHEEYMDMLTSWMSVGMAQKSGIGARRLQSARGTLPFTKMLYVTVGECPNEIIQLKERMEITAICIRSEGDQLTYVRRGNCNIMNLPEVLLEKEMNIYF